MQQKVILFYRFAPVPDPVTTMLWQRSICEANDLRGRIIVSPHGINGTLGGPIDSVKRYVRALRGHPAFRATDVKWSDGRGDEFPRLSVKVRDELVTLGADRPFDAYSPGTALDAAQWDELLRSRDDVLVLDARNDYEHEIGHFRGAVAAPIRAFRELRGLVDGIDRSTPVATYCTGDVRCEYLSAYMRSEGFEEVYHLDGGIVRYGERFGNDGLWEGRCFVFDARSSVAFGRGEAAVVGACASCGVPSDHQVNCAGGGCHAKAVLCEACTSAGAAAICRVCAAERDGVTAGLAPVGNGSQRGAV